MSDTLRRDATMGEPVLQVENVDKSYRNGEKQVKVLEDFDLTLREAECKCLLGRSGCGKTTLLKCIAGIEDIDGGTITGNPSIGYVFQEDRLFDWKTVRANLSVVLKNQGIPAEERRDRIEWYLEIVGLRDVLDKYPVELSGGMRQRVSIARALAIEPDVLLMDEPFSNLDEITAREVREKFLGIIRELDQSVLFVTHNATEAAFLSSSIAVLDHELPSEIIFEIENPLDFPREYDSKAILNLKQRIVSHI